MKYSFFELREILESTLPTEKALAIECLEHVQYHGLYTIKKYIDKHKSSICKTFDEFAEKFPHELSSNNNRIISPSLTEEYVKLTVDLMFDNKHLTASHLHTILTLVAFNLEYGMLCSILTKSNIDNIQKLIFEVSNELSLRREM